LSDRPADSNDPAAGTAPQSVSAPVPPSTDDTQATAWPAAPLSTPPAPSPDAGGDPTIIATGETRFIVPKPDFDASNINPESKPAATGFASPNDTFTRPASGRTRPLAPPPDTPFGDTAMFSRSPLTESAPTDFNADQIRAYVPMASGIQMRVALALPPTKPPEPVLLAKGLTKRFGKREVVCGVDIEVGEGEVVGLLGRNGAGKTTTFRMIMGLLHPDSGSVMYQNRDITRVPMYVRARRGIGYLAQNPSVFQKMTVEDNLMAMLEINEPSKPLRQQRLEDLIHKLGLDTVRRSIAGVVSGGERRRLEIARAMSLNPKIILFDEPFAAIDPIAVNELQGILRDLKRQGVGILLTDHNVRETLTITDRTYIMDEGKIWKQGSPREIVADSEARARYLGQDFRLDF